MEGGGGGGGGRERWREGGRGGGREGGRGGGREGGREEIHVMLRVKKEEGSNVTFAQLSLPPPPRHCHQLGDPLLHVCVEQQHINKKLPTLTTTFRV